MHSCARQKPRSSLGIWASMHTLTRPQSSSARSGHIAGLLLVNLEKIGLICVGVRLSIFDDNIKNGDFQKVGIIFPIEKALVDQKSNYAKTENS